MISSIDTNVLVYAHNTSALQHDNASRFIQRVLKSEAGEQLLILHQTLFELYAILTNRLIVSKPNHKEAWKVCLYYSSHAAVQTAAYEAAVFPLVRELLEENPERGKRFFDLVMAATMKYHGVGRFYTGNEKDFRQYPFLEVINPL